MQTGTEYVVAHDHGTFSGDRAGRGMVGEITHG